ncbi:Serine/threonine-protein kinase 17B [Myotis davidii]|uniref:Serine/threonine-protein kinase 17B n=1 Tax=Myotis davidii TaxID=225400 RepID=L5LMP2_MYODS|nr:Serine/threonine-protein kinase 17B [Myotis davidii]
MRALEPRGCSPRRSNCAPHFRAASGHEGPNTVLRGKFAVVRQCISKSTGQEYAAKFLKKRRRGQDCRAEILHEIAVLELASAAGGEIFNLCLPELAEMPQNILLSSIYPLGDIKIVDFGMSRKLGNACELREIMGTPEYLAPEILNYDPITTATDMWNIGIIAYMLVTHTSPFVGEDNQETYLNISQVNVDYSEETFSSVSQLATDFIQSLLVKNPEKRPTAEICLTHSWLQQWDFGNLFLPEEMSSPPQDQDHTTRSSEDKTLKSSCNGTCEDREDKENIPEDSSVVSKRFRFDDSLPSPHELVSDVLC